MRNYACSTQYTRAITRACPAAGLSEQHISAVLHENVQIFHYVCILLFKYYDSIRKRARFQAKHGILHAAHLSVTFLNYMRNQTTLSFKKECAHLNRLRVHVR